MQIVHILQEFEQDKQYLLEALIQMQKEKDTHNVTKEEVAIIGEYFSVSESYVCSVISFYTFLSFERKGKHIIQVCKDVPCFLRDDFNIMNTLEDILKIKEGETTKDELFTLEQTACIGCCDEAPAMLIDLEPYTHLSKDKIEKIISSIKEDVHD